MTPYQLKRLQRQRPMTLVEHIALANAMHEEECRPVPAAESGSPEAAAIIADHRARARRQSTDPDSPA